jgi:hypothetical protein
LPSGSCSATASDAKGRATPTSPARRTSPCTC